MPRPEAPAEKVVDVVVGRVLDLRDLLEDHRALPVDLLRVEIRLEKDVRKDVQGERKVLPQHLRVVAGVLLAGEGIEHAADRVDLLGDLLGRAAPGALEEQVLQEVRDTVL